MLSGRYRTEWLARHWNLSRTGTCRSPTCLNLPETLEHLLLWCPAFNETRTSVIRLWLSCSNHDIHNIVSQVLHGSPKKLLKFILDPSANPSVISLYQVHGDEIYQLVFHLTRTWCFALHKVRSQKLSIWPKLLSLQVLTVSSAKLGRHYFLVSAPPTHKMGSVVSSFARFFNCTLLCVCPLCDINFQKALHSINQTRGQFN